MKRSFLALAAAVALACAGSPALAGPEWLTDLEAARKRARSEGKPILMNFTGSDWCVYCKKLHEEVLTQPAFRAWAESSLVLLEVDFPARKPQPADLKKQNQRLAERYGVDGYPTLVFTDGQGKELARTGYRPGGAERWVAHARELLAQAERGESPERPARPRPKPRKPAAPASRPAAGGEAKWTEDYEKALARARRERKLVLTDFTGSDWCGWCIKLKKEVFDTKEFKEWAARRVVLLELDFPRRKPQDPRIRERNQKLLQKYGVRGFPTILFLDGRGKAVGRLGYQPGGPKPWIEAAEKILAGQGR